MKTILLRILLSAVLTAATLKVLYNLNSDKWLFPGYVVAWLFYPGGVHDGPGSGFGWWLVGTCGNVLFYLALWFLILSLLKFPRSKAKVA